MTDYIDQLASLSRKQLMVLLARQHRERTQGIAISGMGCRFPGGIDSPDTLWNALRDGRVVPGATAAAPADSLGRPRWDTAAADLAPLAPTLDKGAYLEGVDLFDAGYFGLGAEEAVHLDPQQRLLLEVTVQALADANLDPQALRSRTVGVYVGLSTAEYHFAGLRNGLGKDDLSPYMGTGTALSAASGRIALALGVQGPALTLDTACSSALTAAHLAAAALRDGECDVAVTGVSHLLLSPFTSEVFAQAGMVSPTGTCRPFTAQADGYVRAEGCGVLVLERHRDVAEDGRRPYAVIRGSAVHQNGDRGGLAAYSTAGQRRVIDLALQRSAVDAHDVRYVEAQANGSRVGGIVEAETLAQAYRRQDSGAPALYLGSAKANLGYLETASGAAGLMKTALALCHGEIPPQPGADEPDPKIGWDRTALRLARTPEPWPSAGRRLAAVSATGFTGTAAHLVMEAVPEPDGTTLPEPTGPALLVLSGHTPQALAAGARRLRAHLGDRADWTYTSVCRTLAERREHLAHRHAAVVHDNARLLEELDRVTGDTQEGAGTGRVFLDLRATEDPHPPAFPALAEHLHGDDTTGRSLAWLSLLRATGVPVAGAVLDLSHATVLAPAVTGSPDAGAVPAGWERERRGDTLVLRRPDAAGLPTTVPGALDEAGWYGLVGAAHRAGARLDLAAVAPRPRPPLCRLPGPALLGTRHWTDIDIWH
ncbi:MAG TPA: beta-ketoacyl synthase N-terminal-like domain-containing protein [Streptomyces sp.]